LIGLNPPGLSNHDVSEYDCYLLAKANPECGKHVFGRPRASRDFAMCWCWKFGSSNPAFDCCGECDQRNGSDWRLTRIK
jgi:hypothetical protein